MGFTVGLSKRMARISEESCRLACKGRRRKTDQTIDHREPERNGGERVDRMKEPSADNQRSGGDTSVGNTRSHPEHDG